MRLGLQTFNITVVRKSLLSTFELDYDEEFLVPKKKNLDEPDEEYTVHIYISGGHNLDFVFYSEEQVDLFVSKVVEYYNNGTLPSALKFEDEHVKFLEDLRYKIHSGELV